jgi:hypothetical protein
LLKKADARLVIYLLSESAGHFLKAGEENAGDKYQRIIKENDLGR